MRSVEYGNILFDVTDGLIVHQVNAQGVMHRGFAMSLGMRYTNVWTDYSREIRQYPTKEESLARLGKVIFSEASPTLCVASIVGQQFYGSPDAPDAPRYTSYDAVDKAFTLIGDTIRGLSGTPGPGIHYPLIGSYRGGGNWPVIRAIIEHRLRGLNHTLWLLPGAVEPT